MRPKIGSILSGDELRRWYWRKDELIEHARALGLKTHSGKFVILDRIAHFLDTGEKLLPDEQKDRAASSFDWSKSDLSRTTVITDNYKNTQNVRLFFQRECGVAFRFYIALMDWMKGNVGRTLGDACEAHRELQELSRGSGFKTAIKSHNQFNQYTRDFLQDNPDMGMDDVRRVWALKIALPSEDGRHRYEPSDLSL